MTRKIKKQQGGRPSQYGFETLAIDQTVEKPFKNFTECEKLRNAALAHARRNGKVFRTNALNKVLYVKRIS